ncbi:hypothetical protein HALA3H3_720043 [Halomonas sp. A3H3]|nr:hypothetical protein HALA3H3_1120002 [Halomonas sp. A3H3]CDG54342.1 hypothetical protein HALA3H3_720043 [Halomonas sp. A3H3]
MIGGPTCCMRIDALETKSSKIETFYERLYGTDRVIVCDEIV